MKMKLGENNEFKEPVGSSDRAFGLKMGGFFLVVAVIFYIRKGSISLTWCWISDLFVILALAAPQILAKPNLLWTRLGLLYAICNFHAALWEKIFPKGWDKNLNSYWKIKNNDLHMEVTSTSHLYLRKGNITLRAQSGRRVRDNFYTLALSTNHKYQ